MLSRSVKCNNTAIRAATRRLGQLYDDVLRPTGLRTTQFAILIRVRSFPDLSMRTLADLLVMDLSALGHTLKPLIRDGFIELVADPRDRRAKLIRLTPSGDAKFVETEAYWRVAQTAFETAYGVERAAELRLALADLTSDEFKDAFQEAVGPAPFADGALEPLQKSRFA